MRAKSAAKVPAPKIFVLFIGTNTHADVWVDMSRRLQAQTQTPKTNTHTHANTQNQTFTQTKPLWLNTLFARVFHSGGGVGNLLAHFGRAAAAAAAADAETAARIYSD